MSPPTNLLTHPPRRPLIAPSILSADFADMGTECAHILRHGADLLHLDVMDGHFVPNLTMGPDLCRCLRRALPEAFLDVHLMVTDPGIYIEPFAKAGANHLTFHIEVCSPSDAATLIARIQRAGMTAGIAINPPTAVDRLDPVLALPDLVLVMSVNPGFSGQSFIESSLDKTRRYAGTLRPDQRLQIDGGVAPRNAAAVRQAGCDVLVAASAVFGVPPDERFRVLNELRSN